MSPVGDDGDIRRAMKGAGRLFDRVAVISGPAGIGRLVPGAHGHQQVPGWTVLQHHMRVDDRQVDILLLIDEHPVGRRQHPFAPGSEEGAIAVEHNQGMLTPIKQIDPVARIRHDAGLAQGPTGRQLCPIFYQLIGVFARPYRGHLRSLLSMKPHGTAAGQPVPLFVPARLVLSPAPYVQAPAPSIYLQLSRPVKIFAPDQACILAPACAARPQPA